MSESVMEIVSVNLSTEKGTIKRPAEQIVVVDHGVVGDAHAGVWHRQVSVLGRDSVERFEKVAGRKIAPGEFAENILLCGIDLREVAILDRFRIGDVELEVTQIGKKCHGDACAIFREVGACVMPKEGIFCRVLRGGTVRAGDKLEYLPKTLAFKIITLSDRAYRGDYADASGPKIRKLLEEFLSGKRWHPAIDLVILPDDADRLRAELISAREAEVDVVLTTGGTGVGPRDITPDVVAQFCDKLIPGIMENIRAKFGTQKPNALLSRSVAAVAGTTLIYALPGSVRAVEEYMGEIFKTLEHLIFMVHDLDIH